MRGLVAGSVNVHGTPLSPRVDLQARGFNLSAADSTRPKPVNVDVHATYDGQKAEVVVAVAQAKGFVATLDAAAQSRGGGLDRASRETPRRGMRMRP